MKKNETTETADTQQLRPAASGAGSREFPRDIFPSGLKGLIFDCDGVLFDSKDANTAFYNHIRTQLGLPPMQPEEAAWAHMASTPEVFLRMAGPERLEEAITVGRATSYSDLFMPLMRPMPRMFEFLQAAVRAGLRLALCTNRSDSVQRVLDHFSLNDFNPVMTVTHVSPKPAPDGLLRIVDIWGADKAHVAYVGDSLVDQQAGNAAGIPVIAFRNPGLSARMHVNEFDELLPLLGPM
ncbi:HAD family hydrolase [Desulfovibrio sp. OttesenSCG-928-I05]|nr:HAD family hydrolase [Desulfovibrio sp. OttesenSCG-928-I05]